VCCFYYRQPGAGVQVFVVVALDIHRAGVTYYEDKNKLQELNYRLPFNAVEIRHRFTVQK
jgi:hypothetical protein